MRKFQDAYRDAVDGLPRRRPAAEELLNGPPAGVRRRGNIWMKGVAAAAVLLLCSVSTATAVNYRKSRISVEPQGYSLTGVTEGNGAEPRMAAYSPDAGKAEDAGCFVETMEEQKEYDSVEGFRGAEQITMALPEPQQLGEEDVRWQIYVTGDGASVTAMLFGEDGRSFMMHQWDTRGLVGYGSATVYAGESANKRTVVNSQGMSYVVFDSVESGEIISTHAVISVNGRELCMDFQGYEEATIEEMLNALDLSAYFAD